VNLWTRAAGAPGPVDNPVSSPVGAPSANPLRQRKRGVIPVIHTLYDYDKGIS
jgi:hypothetical protein